MARKSTMSIVVGLLCLLVLSIQSTLCQPDLKVRDIDKQLSDKLLNKGYGAMAIFGLGEYLDRLLTSAPPGIDPEHHGHHRFLPNRQRFYFTKPHWHSNNLIPFKVDKKTLQSSPVGSTFPTLLANAPSLVKTLHNNESSINDVKIMDWEIYNDGKVIVHGVDAYFNPAFAVVYPTRVAKQDCAECKKINLDDHRNDREIPKGPSSSGSSCSRSFLVLVVLVIGFFCHRYFCKGWHDDSLPVKTIADSLPVKTIADSPESLV